jgi:hypothetical protein
MKELKCKNCGAPLRPDGFCEYCGTHYKFDTKTDQMSVIGRTYVPADVISAKVVIPRHMTVALQNNADDFSKFALNELAHKLAEGLAGYMRLTVEDDPGLLDAKAIRGDVRVLRPDFRY